MADIQKLSRLINGISRDVDLAQNTLVVGNLKAVLTGSNYVTFAGTLTANRTITVPDANVNLGHINNLNSLSGVAGGSNDLGTFTGITIPDTSTIKAALQSLETAVEAANATPEFLDTLFRIKDNLDQSKKLAFEVAAIATATTRTITMPDSNVDLGLIATAIQRDGSVAFTANQSFGTFKATNMADPTVAQDGATKAYVDNLLDGRSWKQSVRAATTANITLSGAQTIDGVSIVASNRVLVKNQTAAEDNGIYVASAGAWTRSSDTNTASELIAAAVFVEEGTLSGDLQFAQTADSIVLGTTAITWVITSANSFSGHDMISLSGGQVSVDLLNNGGLKSSNPGNAAGQLQIALEASNPSLQIISNELGVKLDTAGAIIKNASGLAIAVDDSTIEKSANALRVKDAGITAAKLNTSVADQVTITGGAGTALTVASSPMVRQSKVAGESFAANTSFVVRFAVSGETAGRIYKTDQDATTLNNFYASGLVLSTSLISAGGNINMILSGTHTLGSNDTQFLSTDIGKPVFLTAAGAFSVTAPTTANFAAVRVGVVEDVNKIFVQPQVVGING